MKQLTTTFAGLHLSNPIIISSSGLTNTAQKNKQLEEAGAGAIVLKSLFEEQIKRQAEQMQDSVYYSEGREYLDQYIRSNNLSQHLNLITESKKLCNIPIIASINCYSNSEWVDFAKQIEAAGADALELNILSVQADCNYTYGEFEERHVEILRKVKQQTSLPLIVKLGLNLTNPVALIQQLYNHGASAVVLFNRFYQPDINIDKMEYTTGEVFSSSSDLSNSLRWIALASARVSKMDYASSGGVHCGEGLIKSLLAGASAVEICSTIYKNGNQQINCMLNTLSEWMDKKGYEHIPQIVGLMNASKEKGTDIYERTQFLKYFSTKE